MTSHTQEKSHGLSRSPPYGLKPSALQNQDSAPAVTSVVPPPPGKPMSRFGARTTPPKSTQQSPPRADSDKENRKNGIPRAFLNQPPHPVAEPTWKPSLSHVRHMVHDSPLYQRRPTTAPTKPRGFFAENDPLPIQKSSAAIQTPNGITRIPKRSPGQSSTTSTLSVDSSSGSASIDQTAPPISQVQPPSSLPAALDEDEEPRTPRAKQKTKVDPPKTPNHINPDEGLSARQKVRMGLSGLLLTSEAFRNSTGINSSGRTKRDASPGRTRANNLSQAPISPANSRTSSQGSLKVRTEALVTKLIPTKNSVHSLIGYIKELQSSEASLRTHLESIKTKAQEDLARSYGAVNKLQSSVRQIEEERDQKAQELAKKSHEIDALQAKIEALRKALEKNHGTAALSSSTSSINRDVPNNSYSAPMATIREAGESANPSPTKPPSTKAPSSELFRELLTEFFRAHDNSQLPIIDSLTRDYTGREQTLVQELKQYYGNDAVLSLEQRWSNASSNVTQPGPSQEDVAALLVQAEPAPAPFVMAPDVFVNDVHLQKPPLAPTSHEPLPEEKVLKSCIMHHSNSSNSEESNSPRSSQEAPKLATPVAEAPPLVQSNPPPEPHTNSNVSQPPIEPVNIYQKPRSPRQKPRLQHPIHDPFELSHPPTLDPNSHSAQTIPTSPPVSPSNVNLTYLLNDLYKTHQPDKIKDVSAIVKAYTGKERELIQLLKRKYGALSVKKLELHLPTLLALGASFSTSSASESSSPSVITRIVVFCFRVVLLIVILALFGVGYFGVVSHIECQQNPASTYCHSWQAASSRFYNDPSLESVQSVLELIPEAMPIMESFGNASIGRSQERVVISGMKALKQSIKILQRSNTLAMPDFHGLELLHECASALEAIVHPSRPPRQVNVDMWAILDMADMEAARQMKWIE
ncbi:hypothetical protein AeRB84_000370 [Aphanomyces euteiches]|nr:hypothetical protein AeRB84_000370 [Aphanomyces euteiches]